MDIAVELFFDAASDRRVREIWHKLSASGINSFMEEMGGTPHISLAVYNNIDIKVLRERLAELAHRFSPLFLKLSALGTFPGSGRVLFLAPAVTGEMLELHSSYHQLCADWSELVWPHYRPNGTWFPHCTLAMALTGGALKRAWDLVGQDFVGLGITIQAVAAVQYAPAQILYKFPLGS